MELKTIDGWCKSDCGSWDEYCKPGEVVDEGVRRKWDISRWENHIVQQ